MVGLGERCSGALLARDVEELLNSGLPRDLLTSDLHQELTLRNRLRGFENTVFEPVLEAASEIGDRLILRRARPRQAELIKSNDPAIFAREEREGQFAILVEGLQVLVVSLTIPRARLTVAGLWGDTD